MKTLAQMYTPQIAFILSNVQINPTFVPCVLVHLHSSPLNFYGTSVIISATAVASVPVVKFETLLYCYLMIVI